MSIISIDVDGVLRDWEGALIRMFKKHRPAVMKNPDMKELTSWELIDDFNLPIDDIRKLFSEDYVYEVYNQALPYNNVVVDFIKLSNWAEEQGHTLICVTSQSNKKTKAATLEWLGRWGFHFERVIFGMEKHQYGMDFIVDDSPKEYHRWVHAGKNERKFILYSRPMNENVNATSRVSSLKDVPMVIEGLQSDNYFDTLFMKKVEVNS